MIQQYNINEKFNKNFAQSIIDEWMIEENKVFHLTSSIQKEKIRDCRDL